MKDDRMEQFEPTPEGARALLAIATVILFTVTIAAALVWLSR